MLDITSLPKQLKGSSNSMISSVFSVTPRKSVPNAVSRALTAGFAGPGLLGQLSDSQVCRNKSSTVKSVQWDFGSCHY